MAVRIPTLSYSQINAFKCKLQWFWAYKEGYQPRQKTMALELGSAIHKALEQYYKNLSHDVEQAYNEKTVTEDFRNYMIQLYKQIQANPMIVSNSLEDVEEAAKLGMEMLKNYFNEYREKDDFTFLKNKDGEIISEHNLTRKLPGAKCIIVARVDGLVRDNINGKLFILEHKTFKRFEEDSLHRDEQFTIQVWVGEQLLENLNLNEKVEGVIFNGLRKTFASPRLKNPLFERHIVFRNNVQINYFLLNALNTFKTIMKKKLDIYPEPDQIKCNSCNFKEPCLELIRGGDYEFILKNLFTKRADKKAVEIIIIEEEEN